MKQPQDNFKSDKVNNNVLYAVLKLSQDIAYTDTFTGEERKQKLHGIAGFIPCYETIEEAEEAACNGKFQIMLIMPA
jgi:hypothetical protein